MPSLKSSREATIWGSPPHLAVLTEPDACASVERAEETLRAIERATRDGSVDLVVVRVADGPGDGGGALRKRSLLGSLAEMKRTRRFALVVNDDVELALEALSLNVAVDGVHVKEYKAHRIPSIREALERAATRALGDGPDGPRKNVIVGTSCHSLQSARESYLLSPRGPDYFFVGTCYPTQSHPEKQSAEQLEGPTLPGRVREDLHRMYHDKDGSVKGESHTRETPKIAPPTTPRSSTLSCPPVVYAIGGIDEDNCHEPVVRFGADGVATIRTVMQAADPRETVRRMKDIMTNEKGDV